MLINLFYCLNPFLVKNTFALQSLFNQFFSGNLMRWQNISFKHICLNFHAKLTLVSEIFKKVLPKRRKASKDHTI